MSEVKEEIKSKGIIIWVSSSPFVGDACGKQSHYVCKGLVEAGYDVEYLAWNWKGIASGAVYDIDGAIVFYPYGLNSVISGAKKLYNLHCLDKLVYETLLSTKPQAIVTLGDFQNVYPIGQMAAEKNVKWYNWFPFDYIDWEVTVAKAYYELDCHLVTMSDWGYKLASENFYQPTANIYHGVDTGIFRPSTLKKTETRKLVNLPDSVANNFIVGFVGQNMERKRLDKLIEGFSLFAKGKSNVTLLAHTNPFQDDRVNPSYPLVEMAARSGLTNNFLYTHPVNYAIKYSDNAMANLYNSMNIMVLPSSGEGFGVPVLEGNACGIPTIMTNSTSAQQLVGQGQGYLADVDSTYIFRGFRRAMVSAKSIAKWLEFTYNNPNALLQTSATAVADAQRYDFKLIQSQWVDLLSK